MEFAISSQPANIIRWAFAFIITYMVMPAIIFPVSGDTRLERFFTRYVRMVAVTIIMGYILVALKMYEALSLLIVSLLLVILFRLPANNQDHLFSKMRITFFVKLYDFLDGIFDPYQSARNYLAQIFIGFKTKISALTLRNNTIQTVLFLAVLAYSAYLRFYDTLRHAAPSMADAYVTLAWMKYIDGRILFHDGIYPQGFYIYLSLLHKFAANDALYVMKYTGPLNGVLITISIYLFVEKVTGRKLTGIISAFVFGVLGGILPVGWDRQGGSLPQEFGMVFLLPAWYYAIAFLQTRKKHYLWTAAGAFAVIGLVHTLILGFLWVGLACLVFAYLLLDFKQTLRSSRYLITAGILTGVVAGLPALIGLLGGLSFHGSSVQFLKLATQAIEIPVLTIIDKLGLVGFVLFLISSVWQRKAGSNRVIALFIFFLGISSFLLYLIIGPWSGNVLLLVRSGVLWSLMASIGVGIGAEALLQIIPGRQNALKSSVLAIITLFIMAWAVTYYKPLPALPNKMQYDAEINQYLRISKEHTPAEWTIVSAEEGYDLALGKGWHIQLSDFLEWYNPQKGKLIKSVDGKVEPLIARDLFIFYQKKLFFVEGKAMEPILAQRVKNYAALEQWIIKYQENHNDMNIYYEDDFIVIYHLQDLKA